MQQGVKVLGADCKAPQLTVPGVTGYVVLLIAPIAVQVLPDATAGIYFILISVTFIMHNHPHNHWSRMSTMGLKTQRVRLRNPCKTLQVSHMAQCQASCQVYFKDKMPTYPAQPAMMSSWSVMAY